MATLPKEIEIPVRVTPTGAWIEILQKFGKKLLAEECEPETPLELWAAMQEFVAAENKPTTIPGQGVLEVTVKTIEGAAIISIKMDPRQPWNEVFWPAFKIGNLTIRAFRCEFDVK